MRCGWSQEAFRERVIATPKPMFYNTSMVISPRGRLEHTHRKIHLFKINSDTVRMDESEVLSAGCEARVVSLAPEWPGVKMGVSICFDVRFPQLASAYAEQGSSLIVVPGAFNLVTGPAHWHLAARSRAVDTQQHVCMCSPARDVSAGYVAYGHSVVVSPWGGGAV